MSVAVGVIVATLSLVVALWIRFTHPALTETQLLAQFWVVWLVLFAAHFAVIWWNRRSYVRRVKR